MQHRMIPLTPALVLFAVFLAGLFGIWAPVSVMLPFQAQQSWAITAAQWMGSWGTALSLTLAAIAAAAAYSLWRSGGWKAKTLAIVGVLPVVGFAVITQVNLAETYFAPATRADLARIGGYKEIGDRDMVIGVVLGSETRAYPVRYLAYHHMLNDQLGGRPILPNY